MTYTDGYLSQIVCSNYSPTEVYEIIGVFKTYDEALKAAEKILNSEDYDMLSMAETYVEKIKLYLGDNKK